MRTKKTAIAIIMFSVIAIVVGVKFADAQAYTPLVQIPGIDPGAVNLSMYLVGLYDFLLSVVGIVAVLMLIVGGMRYITAAGNQAAVSDAKDIITNALVGLLLAILSWVIVAEINPDVLYIKKPGGEFASTTPWMHGLCMDPAALLCTCKDGASLTSPPNPPSVLVNAKDCDNECRARDHCGLGEMECTFPTSLDVSDGDLFYDPVDEGGQGGLCKCIDGEDVKPVTLGTPCNTVCSDPAEAGAYDDGKGPVGEYHGINWRLKVGHTAESVASVDKSENFTVNVNERVFFDFSEIRDCKDNLVHFAIRFDGPPNWFALPPTIPDEWCCMKYNSGCTGTWGVCCENNGCGRLGSLGCQGTFPICFAADLVPKCFNDSHNYDSPTFPIYKHSFSAKSPFNDPEDVWVGISVVIDGVCEEFQKIFQVDVK